MTQYLLTVVEPTGGSLPDNIDEIVRDVQAVNQEMHEAGIWVFAGGLHNPSTATTLRPNGNGEVLPTDGPFAEGKEHVGGFSIIEASDLDEALSWGTKLSKATTLPIEVRPFRHGAATD